MPLDAEGEAPVGRLDRLGQVVELAPARNPQTLAELVDPLVVVRLGAVVLLAGRPGGERARLEPDVVVGVVERADRAAMVLVAARIGDVLVERAARGDV